jgi:hypothetical protein
MYLLLMLQLPADVAADVRLVAVEEPRALDVSVYEVLGVEVELAVVNAAAAVPTAAAVAVVAAVAAAAAAAVVVVDVVAINADVAVLSEVVEHPTVVVGQSAVQL